ncbi:MAG: class I SAM-dependent methyltransferase, partial [Actinomycetia bacterium]|nr:class I SAM-dependent methyltransferase [Actinomycetes bacterium]
QSASFDATRQKPWPGWQRCLAANGVGSLLSGDAQVGGEGVARVRERAPSPSDLQGNRDPAPLSATVFDLGCGNLRFARFLTSEFPSVAFDFYAVDNCDALLPAEPAVHFQHLDILAALQQDPGLNPQLMAPPCDLSVAFGLLHHVPLPEHRAAVLSTLVDQTRPGGFVVVSLWQFLRDPIRAQKARVIHEHALAELGLPSLDPGDFLLGWKDLPGVYRYCHSFSDAEVDALAASVAGRATVVDRFRADGRTGDLNTYLILKTL